MNLPRRQCLYAAAALLAGCARAAAPKAMPPSFGDRLVKLERETGGRFGVAAWDLQSGQRLGYREHERFPMCSTFKFPLAGAVLRRVDAGQESLTRRIDYDASVLLDHSPITSQHVAEGGMTVEQLCHATITTSDNAAANLLLQTLSGPAGLTAFFRSLGDSVSRLDRNEPALNLYAAGDERDTTTAAAMLQNAHALLVSTSVLSEASRRILGEWLEGTTTGMNRLRSAFPRNQRSGDKTGTGDHGATNDVAIAWRAEGQPLLVTAYSLGLPDALDARGELIGRVGRIVVESLGF
jgi:beta-lactamase class A